MEQGLRLLEEELAEGWPYGLSEEATHLLGICGSFMWIICTWIWAWLFGVQKGRFNGKSLFLWGERLRAEVSGASVSPSHLVPWVPLLRGLVVLFVVLVFVSCWCFQVPRFLQLLHVLLTCKRISDRQGYVLDRLWRKKILLGSSLCFFLVVFGSSWFLLVLVGCGWLWVVVGCCGLLWVVVGCCGLLWVVVGCCGLLWVVGVGGVVGVDGVVGVVSCWLLLVLLVVGCCWFLVLLFVGVVGCWVVGLLGC